MTTCFAFAGSRLIRHYFLCTAVALLVCISTFPALSDERSLAWQSHSGKTFSNSAIHNASVDTHYRLHFAEEHEKLPILQLLVSYVYYETDRQSSCERLNKRMNLAMFLKFAVASSPPNVRFHFTFPGLRPSVQEFLKSLNISANTETGRHVVNFFREASPGIHVRLHNASIAHPAADLCHHYQLIKSRLDNGAVFDFVFTVNDGVRGPFVDDKIAEVRVTLIKMVFDRSALASL